MFSSTIGHILGMTNLRRKGGKAEEEETSSEEVVVAAASSHSSPDASPAAAPDGKLAAAAAIDDDTTTTDDSWDVETLNMIQKIRTSLAEATSIDESSSSSKQQQAQRPRRIATPCGHGGVYLPDRQSWQVRFRPSVVQQRTDGGVLAPEAGPPSPASRPPTVWVARLWWRQEEEESDEQQTPEPALLIRYILQCCEFRNMIQQIQSQLEERRALSRALKVACRPTGNQLDWSPLLLRLADSSVAVSSGRRMSKLERLRHVIDELLSCASPQLCSWYQQEEWGVELDSRQEVSESTADQRLVKFVKACLEHPVEGQPTTVSDIEEPIAEEKKEVEMADAAETHASRPAVRASRSVSNEARSRRSKQPIATGSSDIEETALSTGTGDTKNHRKANRPARATRSAAPVEATTEDIQKRPSKDPSRSSTKATAKPSAAIPEPPAESSRPKRKILKAVAFDPTPMTTAEVSALLRMQVKTGSGFPCPECASHCLYTDTVCSVCLTKCEYVPGVGARIASDDTEAGLVSKHTAGPGSATGKRAPHSTSSATPGRTSKRIKLNQSESKGVTRAGSRSQVAQPSRDDQSKHFREVEVGICEACLKPFGLFYLERHRAEQHGMKQGELGCPHCNCIYLSAEARLEHMKESHSGLPMQSSIRDLSKLKRHVYLCPICNSWFSWAGLQRHLRKSHNTEVEDIRADVKAMCPFCPWSDTNTKQFRFRSDEEVREHVLAKHKGCQLLDDFMKQQAADERAAMVRGGAIAKRHVHVATTQEGRVARASERLKDPPKSQPIPTAAPASSLDGWKPLGYKDLLGDYAYGNYVPVSFGTSLASAITAAETQLQDLKEDYKPSTIDQEYVTETKQGYNKELRTRTQKADAERIEKVRHREEVERKLMQLEYDNRGKKKSSRDIEYEAFLERPIQFIAGRKTIKHSACDAGEECELCFTQEEEEAQPEVIMAPHCQAMTVKDFWADTGEADGEGDGRKRRRGADTNKTNRSVMMLTELHHSLRFVAEYNAGFS